VNAAITGLQQATRYHFRVVASSASGGRASADLTILAKLACALARARAVA
jgi:hypothetical protein